MEFAPLDNKLCTKCGAEKPLHDFYKSGNGFRGKCKVCEKAEREARKNTVYQKADNMASSIRKRLGNPTGNNACYKGVKCLLGDTHAEVREYILKHFAGDIASLLDKGETPSIDRIDPNGHYKHGNVRVISFTENSLLGARKGTLVTSKPVKAIAPDGTATVFTSVSEASRILNIKRDTIIKNRDNGTLTKRGYKFLAV